MPPKAKRAPKTTAKNVSGRKNVPKPPDGVDLGELTDKDEDIFARGDEGDLHGPPEPWARPHLSRQ